MRLPFRPEFRQPAGVVHGGVIASLIDSVVVPAVGSGYDEPRQLFTIDIQLRFLAPIIDDDLVAKGWITQRGRSVVFCDAEVRAGVRRTRRNRDARLQGELQPAHHVEGPNSCARNRLTLVCLATRERFRRGSAGARRCTRRGVRSRGSGPRRRSRRSSRVSRDALSRTSGAGNRTSSVPVMTRIGMPSASIAAGSTRAPPSARAIAASGGVWNVLSCWYRNARAGSRVTSEGPSALCTPSRLSSAPGAAATNEAKCCEELVGPQSADGVRQREREHPVGCASANAVAHQPPIDCPTRCTVDAARVEDGGEIGDRGVRAEHAGVERREAEAAAVPRDDAVAGGGERRHLLEPRRVRAARAVREHDRRRVVGAGHLVVDGLAARMRRLRFARNGSCRCHHRVGEQARAPEGERVIVGERAEVVGRHQAAFDELPGFGQHPGASVTSQCPRSDANIAPSRVPWYSGANASAHVGSSASQPKKHCRSNVARTSAGERSPLPRTRRGRPVFVGLAEHVQRGIEVADAGPHLVAPVLAISAVSRPGRGGPGRTARLRRRALFEMADEITAQRRRPRHAALEEREAQLGEAVQHPAEDQRRHSASPAAPNEPTWFAT